MNIYDTKIALLELVELPFDLKMLLGEAKILYYEHFDNCNCKVLIEKIESECSIRGIRSRIKAFS